jgi:non-haem Fe2+, alpha-ketoglutarate-dependent halogenase
MAKADGPILTQKQLAEYEELGFIHSIPILSEAEVASYRAEVEKTCQAIGGNVARLDAVHLFFRWAWDLSTHPRLLNCLEQLLGPDIVLKSTRLFYKYGKSNAYVGWHQDGVTERLEDKNSPAIWLGLTAATVENGCLRVVPGSHRQGFLPHDARPIQDTLAGDDNLGRNQVRSRERVDELSGRITMVPPDVSSPVDLVMRPGEMSIHQPLILHGSNANLSSGPRIGLSASYSTPDLCHLPSVVWSRGDWRRDEFDFEVIDEPPATSLAEAVAAYRASEFQILFANV